MLKRGAATLTIGALMLTQAARAQGANDGVTSEPTAGSTLAPKPPKATPATPATPTSRWCGWQPLAADLASFGVVYLGITQDNKALGQVAVPVGVVSYLFTPLLIHDAHHQRAVALADLGLRIGLPLLSGLLAQPLCRRSSSDVDACPAGAFLRGATVGAFAASVIDSAGLSWERPRVEAAVHSTEWGLAPATSSDGKRAELRLVGTF